MKTFSVRFYKRLFLLLLLLMILVPLFFALWFGIRTAALEKQLAEIGNDPAPTHSSSPGEPGYTPGVVPTGYDLTLEAQPIYYQTLYHDLYGTAQVSSRDENVDTIYLTFDCKPNSNTTQILDILDQYEIKATFFIAGTTDEAATEIMQDIVGRGHTIGLRNYSSSLQKIYSSVEDYLNDFKQIYDLVYEATGVRAEIFRFPSGSVNSYNSAIYQELIAEMLRRNFIFFDYDIGGGGINVGQHTPEQISETVLAEMARLDRAIIMLRDTEEKTSVPGALPTIIEELRSKGYNFQPLTATVLPVVFSYESSSYIGT